MKLIPISEHPDHAKILYQLLEERPAEASISHKKMPTWDEHLEHVALHSRSWPWNGPLAHNDWCITLVNEVPVGAIYLSCRNELGPAILKAHQRRGYGEAECRAIMAKHGPRRYLWNVNPENAASIALGKKLGFRLVQHTYALEAE